jgi:hypothetical protein
MLREVLEVLQDGAYGLKPLVKSAVGDVFHLCHLCFFEVFCGFVNRAGNLQETTAIGHCQVWVSPYSRVIV